MLLDLLFVFVGIPLSYILISKLPVLLGKIADKLGIETDTDKIPDQTQKKQVTKHLQEQDRTAGKASIAHLEQGRL